MSKFGNVLREMDLFSSQVGLQVNNSFFYKTRFGGLASILSITMILIFIWPRVISFSGKDEVKVVINRVYSPSPPESSISPDRFMFALRVYQNNRDFLTNPYFNITVQQGVYQIEGNQQIRKFYDIELEPCTPNHWESMKSYSNFTKLFESYGSDYLCPTFDSQLFIQGMFGSETFAFIQINVVPCITPNNPKLKWNPVCAPQEEVDQVTQQVGFHGMNIYHSNYVLNVDQPQNFFTPYINDKLYFTFVPYKMTKLCDIYFQDISVVNDMSLLPTTDNKYFKFLTQENNDILQTTELSRQDGVFVSLTIRLSPYVTSIDRSYQKLTQFLSELGGLAQIVFVCAGFILKKYNNFRFVLDLANTLYSFEKSNKQEISDNVASQFDNPNKQDTNIAPSPVLQPQRGTQQNIQVYASGYSNQNSFNLKNQVKEGNNSRAFNNNQNFILSQDILSENKFFSSNQIGEVNPLSSPLQIPKSSANRTKQKTFEQNVMSENEYQEIDKKEKEKEDGKSYLIKQFNKILQQKQNLKIGFQYIISKITINKFFNSEYNQYINKATKMINNDLDIYNILEKIQQIDKIKNIIFDKYQSLIFQYHPKPIITLDQQPKIDQVKQRKKSIFQPQKGILLEKQEFQTVEQFEKLFDSYQTIKQNQEYTNHDKNINHRLIRQLGSDLLHIFQVSENLDIVDTSKYKSFQRFNSIEMEKSKYFKSQHLQSKTNQTKQLQQLNLNDEFKQNSAQQITFDKIKKSVQLNVQVTKPRMSLHYENQHKNIECNNDDYNSEKEQHNIEYDHKNVLQQEQSQNMYNDQDILPNSIDLSSCRDQNDVPDENEKGGMDKYKVTNYAHSQDS
ncbi:transmembrane protein, putative (macronuclear) [Tetrahymena thermophila SB210]|uniref:Transmembrane protein, putative n=1 Tax=Tetrahymena thermophila (strain SB210) TaxID=312017 RepID=Q22W72_TETTS|nr:transmembrane protein, putative [Tetrahymena thermophila SB210]EAR89545.2 transmembrane protein, putative [Tetrahymena thermophila SB210]|eukprot:XP_001009790.2 transmembrane protein, putative [Tetrahymena thermophila SB210]